jgi:hypothetical protein
MNKPTVDEFFCPECGRTSASKTLCPEHQIPMLDFLEWIEIQKRIRKKWMARGLLVAIALVLGYFIWVMVL